MINRLMPSTMKLLRYAYKQPNDYTCGPAVARVILHSHGYKHDIKTISRELKTTRAGTANVYLTKFFRKKRLNFRIKRNAGLSDIRKFIKNHHILVAYWIPSHKESHYSIIKKLTKDRVCFHDTWFGSNHSYSINYFLKNWWDDETNRWMMIIKKADH